MSFLPQKKSPFIDTLSVVLLILMTVSAFMLNSLDASLFPGYYLFLFFAFMTFIISRRIEFEVYVSFSKFLYLVAIILLTATLIIGSVTRGTVRWIPIGSFAFQPSEVVRAFLYLYFADCIVRMKKNLTSFLYLAFIAFLPTFLIFIQPSLGVAVITLSGFVGMILSKGIGRKTLIISGLIGVTLLGVLFILLKPYQKERILTFLNPSVDPLGAGYNSIQSVIAVGSGTTFGKGLGGGVQTQLRFLPEAKTDFVFAALSEEMGFLGSIFILTLVFYIIYKLILKSEESKNETRRIYVVAVIFSFFTQVVINVGMNLGVLPITGVPLPFLSAGGSSLLGSVLMLSIAFSK